MRRDASLEVQKSKAEKLIVILSKAKSGAAYAHRHKSSIYQLNGVRGAYLMSNLARKQLFHKGPEVTQIRGELFRSPDQQTAQLDTICILIERARAKAEETGCNRAFSELPIAFRYAHGRIMDQIAASGLLLYRKWLWLSLE